MEEIQDHSVALMVTSPPYNVGMEYEKKKPFKEYLDFLNQVWSAAQKKLIPGGRFAINIANIGRNPYVPLSSYITQQLLDLGMFAEGEIIWQKPVANSFGSCAWGSWLMPSNPILEDRHEYILIFRKDERRRNISSIHPTIKDKSRLEKNDFLNLRASTWQMRPSLPNGHPCPFPEELPNRLIRLYTFSGDIVLDPFMGRGTTAIEANKLDRHYVGYEIVRNYCEIAQNNGVNIQCNTHNPLKSREFLDIFALDTGTNQREGFHSKTRALYCDSFQKGAS